MIRSVSEWSSGSLSTFCGYFPGSGEHSGRDTPAGLQNSHTGSLTCGLRAIMVRKAEQKLLTLPLPRKLLTQRQYYIPRGTAEISAAIKDLKDTGVDFSPTYSTSPIWPLLKKVDPGE